MVRIIETNLISKVIQEKVLNTVFVFTHGQIINVANSWSAAKEYLKLFKTNESRPQLHIWDSNNNQRLASIYPMPHRCDIYINSEYVQAPSRLYATNINVMEKILQDYHIII